MVHPLLRPFYDPPLRTYGEFVTFFAQICEVRHLHDLVNRSSHKGYNSCIQITLLIGIFTVTFSSTALPQYDLGRDCTWETSCLTQQICIPSLSTLLTWDEVKIFATRSRDIRGPGAQRDTSSSTSVFPADTILLHGPPLDEPLQGGDKSAPEHQDGKTPCNPFPTDVYYLGNLVRQDYIQVCVPNPSRNIFLT
jgi:hypothetical protein